MRKLQRPLYIPLAYTFIMALATACQGQTAGLIDSTFDPGAGSDGEVLALAPTSDGGVLAGGIFTKWGGQPHNGLVRLKSDGSLDPAFSPQFSLYAQSGVYVIAPLADGSMFVGGGFQSVNGTAVQGVVRLHADGTLDASFRPAFSTPTQIFALIPRPDGTVIAAGVFASVGGVARSMVVRLRADGSADPTFTTPVLPSTGTAEAVAAAALQSDGRIVAGGNIDSWSVNGVTLRNPLRVNTNGVLDDSFFINSTSPSSYSYYSIAVWPDDSFIAGGSAGVSNTQPLRWFTANGTPIDAFAPKFTGVGTTAALVQQVLVEPDGHIVVGGSFATVNGNATPQLVRLFSDGTVDTRFAGAGDCDGAVNAVAHDSNGRLLVAGPFTRFQGVSRAGIVRLLNPLLPPLIRADPVSATVGVGANTKLTVATEPLFGQTYQWFLNGQAINGATDPSLYVVSVAQNAAYYVEVTNATGMTRSRTANLTAIPPKPGGVDLSFAPRSLPAGYGNTPSYYYIVAVRPDGRAIVSSSLDAQAATRTLQQLNLDGSLDSQFAIPISTSGGAGLIYKACLDADGRLFLVLGNPNAATSSLKCYLANGTPDPNFSLRGVTVNDVQTVAVLPNGKLLVGGLFTSGNNSLPLIQTAADGTYDPGFGVPSGAFGKGGYIERIGVLPDGRILVSGVTGAGATVDRPGQRLLPDGSIDPKFAQNFLDREFVISPAGAVYSDGSRLRDDGSVDPTFKLNLTQQQGRLSFSATPTQMWAEADEKVVLLGTFDHLNGTAVTPPVRVNSDGSLDSAFSAPTMQAYIGSIGSSLATSSSIQIAAEALGRLYFTGSFSKVQGLDYGGAVALYRNGPSDLRLVNISTRAFTGANANVMIAGFVVGGTDNEPLLLRGAGPSLAKLGVPEEISGATLQLFQGQRVVAENSDWSSSAAAVTAADNRVGAFGFTAGSKDAAMIQSLAPGTYTMQLNPPSEEQNVALVELYEDGSATTHRLLNLSTRAMAGQGDRIMIAGFVLRGTGTKQLLIRAAGPSLSVLGVPSEMVLANPRLQIVSGGHVIATNDDWSLDTNASYAAAAARQVGAFPFPSGSKDAALLVTLQSGNYSILIDSADGATGIALAEVYDVSN